jgi:hypothetical protein
VVLKEIYGAMSMIVLIITELIVITAFVYILSMDIGKELIQEREKNSKNSSGIFNTRKVNAKSKLKYNI